MEGLKRCWRCFRGLPCRWWRSSPGVRPHIIGTTVNIPNITVVIGAVISWVTAGKLWTSCNSFIKHTSYEFLAPALSPNLARQLDRRWRTHAKRTPNPWRDVKLTDPRHFLFFLFSYGGQPARCMMDMARPVDRPGRHM